MKLSDSKSVKLWAPWNETLPLQDHKRCKEVSVVWISWPSGAACAAVNLPKLNHSRCRSSFLHALPCSASAALPHITTSWNGVFRRAAFLGIHSSWWSNRTIDLILHLTNTCFAWPLDLLVYSLTDVASASFFIRGMSTAGCSTVSGCCRPCTAYVDAGPNCQRFSQCEGPRTGAATWAEFSIHL